MFSVRIHGRGGQGGRMSARVIGRAGFLEGLLVQDFPVYGAERRGAPISDYVRISGEQILERGYIEEPDAVLVLDETIMHSVHVRDGLKENGFVLVNSSNKFDEPHAFSVDATLVALEVLGKPVSNIALLGAFARLQKTVSLEKIIEAARIEMAEHGIRPETIEKNIVAAKKCYDLINCE